MTALRLEQLTKTFPGGVPALAGIDLDVRDGERVTLVGPSGGGKTTLLRLVAGLETPTSGRVVLGGRDVTALPPYRRNVAMVFQRPALYPHLSVRDNLLFGGRLRGIRPDPERLRRVVDSLELGDLLARRPAALSGGQQQRVALGRALLAAPAVLLLDEPYSNLDVVLRREIRDKLHLLRATFPATIIHVTHDPDEARQLGDRTVVLDRGRVVQVGTPDAIRRAPANDAVRRLLGLGGGEG